MTDDTPRRTRFTAWITKYALTEGILKMQVQDCFDTSLDMVRRIDLPHCCFHRNEWHRIPEGAIKRAKEMQVAKLKSIDEQRARIAALKFEVEK